MQKFFKKTSQAVSAPGGGGTIASALSKATANTTQPLQQQEMLFLLGAGFFVYKKYGDKLGLPGGGPPLASREVTGANVEIQEPTQKA